MKKILGLAIVALLVMALVVGGVWSYFSDWETNPDNILTAGTLDLSPTTNGTGTDGKYTVTAGGDGINGQVVFTKMLPGESGNITWLLVNNGTISGSLVITSNVTFSDVSQNEVENAVVGNDGGGNGDLDDFVGVKLQRGVGTDQSGATANLTYLLGSAGNYVPFFGLETILNAENVTMAASGGDDTVLYWFNWNIASDIKGAGPDGLFGTGDDIDVNENIIQSDSAEIDITFTLNQ